MGFFLRDMMILTTWNYTYTMSLEHFCINIDITPISYSLIDVLNWKDCFLKKYYHYHILIVRPKWVAPTKELASSRRYPLRSSSFTSRLFEKHCVLMCCKIRSFVHSFIYLILSENIKRIRNS